MATSPKRQSSGGSADWAAQFQLEPFLERWGNTLLASARRNSPTAADADDAYQRAIEKLLTRFPDCESEEHLVAWLHTVIRNETIDMHRASRNVVDAEFEMLAETLVGDEALPEESAIEVAELAWGREALARIRPDQTRCLLLKADGLSNPEICEATGFSYAKVNRLLSEGRTALSTRARSIESGRECQRVEPMLILLANEQATVDVLNDVNPHLEHCVACRTTLRELREAPQSIAALLPLGTALPASDASIWSRIGDQFQGWIATLQERVFGHATAQTGEVLTAKKLAAGAAVVAALAGGGVAVEHGVQDQRTTPYVSQTVGTGIGSVLTSVNPASRTGSGAATADAAPIREATAADAARLIESEEVDDARRTIVDETETGALSGDPRDAAPIGAEADPGDVGVIAP